MLHRNGPSMQEGN